MKENEGLLAGNTRASFGMKSGEGESKNSPGLTGNGKREENFSDYFHYVFKCYV